MEQEIFNYIPDYSLYYSSPFRRHLDIMDLFLLPKTVRCLVVSLLLSAVKVDKDVGQVGGTDCIHSMY